MIDLEYICPNVYEVRSTRRLSFHTINVSLLKVKFLVPFRPNKLFTISSPSAPSPLRSTPTGGTSKAAAATVWKEDDRDPRSQEDASEQNSQPVSDPDPTDLEKGKGLTLTPIKMQTQDAIRVPGLTADLNQQITKFDSSEFDVSEIYFIAPLVLRLAYFENIKGTLGRSSDTWKKKN